MNNRKMSAVQLEGWMLSVAVDNVDEKLGAIVQALVKAVEAKDVYTAGHSERVMRYSCFIGEALALSAQEMETLRLGTLIHDIGKLNIPTEILVKPDRLTASEYLLVKKHAQDGVKMIEDIPFFQDCMPIVRWHHERLNGTGYPDGLQADAIPLLVRIAAVADVFDAMTSNRSYRAAMPVSEATSILRAMAEAGELDPAIVEILAEIVLKDGALWVDEGSHAA